MTPVTVTLSVKARIWREGRLWVADCPALGVTSQGKSERDARSNFRGALELAFEVSRDRGSFDALMVHAAAHPETLWDSVEDSELAEFSLPMPLSDFLHARGQAVRKPA